MSNLAIEKNSVSKDYINPKVLAYFEEICEMDSEDVVVLMDTEVRIDQCEYELDSHKYGSPYVLESECYDVDLYVWNDCKAGFDYYASVRIGKHNLLQFDD